MQQHLLQAACWTALAEAGHLECTAAAAMAGLRIDDIEAVEPESFSHRQLLI
jgi:hypothetical protein